MKPWDDIILTEEEKEAAILEGKKRKWFHEKHKEYWTMVATIAEENYEADKLRARNKRLTFKDEKELI